MPFTLVLLRHGESTWNKDNLFTGWIDVPLSERGVVEARRAGTLMAAAGLEPDIVHTSVLARAIQTVNLALEEMGRLWLPVVRHWRLNERHYGALQGLNKAQTAAKYGEDQVFAWRRSYDVPPPPLDPGDPTHPRHDPRYRHFSPVVLPDRECLADVVDRMLPYWDDDIVPDLRRGLTVLVGAHGNSLRALVQFLDGLSNDEVAALNIPTGFPLVYELDDDMKPATRRYLGDPDEVEAAAHAVARQAAGPS